MIKVTFTDEIEIITSTEHLYQWDVGQVLEIGGLTNIGTPMVHFGVKGDTTGYAVQSEMVNGKLRCGIPDIVLQSGKQIVAYVYVSAGASKYTDRVILIPVVERNKPNNYTTVNMSDVTQTQSFFDSMVDRIELLETRMNTFTELPDGSTTGDAELIDGRIDYKGRTHDNIGTHIRTVSEELDVKKVSIEAGKNKFNNVIITEGYLYGNGGIAQSQSYFTSDYIPVIANQPVSISGTIRKFLGFNSNKEPLAETMCEDAITNYTYTPTENGYIRFSAMYDYINSIMVAYSDNYEDYEPYTPSLQNDIALNEKQKEQVKEEINKSTENYSSLIGKTIVNFGDSIAENRTDSTSYAVQLRGLTGGTLYNYAQGGSTISRLENQTMGCILTQVENYISTHANTKTDIVLINGGANDYSQSRVVGSVTKTSNHYALTDYTVEFDETTYLGALELCIKKLRESYVDSIIVFVIPHKHNRLDDKWETMMNGAREICKKWCISVLDMDKDGQLNSRLPQMRIYTDAGGTHQNTLGNTKYYLPKLVRLLENYFI